MPSLSERIALHQSTVDSAVSIPTYSPTYPGADIREWTYEGSGTFRHQCGLSHTEPTSLGMATFRSAPWCDCGPTLRVDPASGDVVPYRAPWRDNLTARDETNRL